MHNPMRVNLKCKNVIELANRKGKELKFFRNQDCYNVGGEGAVTNLYSKSNLMMVLG